jgi:ATP-binding cassette, subfamily B, bacterial
MDSSSVFQQTTGAFGSTARLYLRALREARRYWRWLGLVLLLGCAGIPLALLAPVPVKLVIDNVLGGTALPDVLTRVLPSVWMASADGALALVIVLSVLIALLTAVHHALDWFVREFVAERMVLDFRSKLFLHTLHTSALHHGSEGAHEPAYRINLDAPALQWTALYGIIPVVVALAALTGTLYVTWRLAPALALTALMTSVPLLVLIHCNQHRLRGRWHGVREQESAAQSVVQEALGALRVVTVFGQEQRELERFEREAKRGLARRLGVVRLEGGLALLMGLATALGTTVILFLGVREVQAGALTAGGLLLILGYIAQLYAPLQAIGTHLTTQQRALVSAERAFALLDGRKQLTERPDARSLERVRGEVRFEHVRFAYPGAAQRVFEDVSLDVAAGARVGIVGRSGAGKSTLINLVIRLFDPDGGRVLLDGIDVRDVRLADLRAQFSVVSQDVALFSTTIAENIAYARPHASRAEIVAAATLGGAHDFICRLPNGYETPLGANGMTLSGGERQRVALARAFLKDAPILVLDEPTSALDADSERGVRAALETLMRGRTVFVIAHQSGVLEDVDFLLRVGGGRVMHEDRPLPQLLAVS